MGFTLEDALDKHAEWGRVTQPRTADSEAAPARGSRAARASANDRALREFDRIMGGVR